MRTLNFLRLLTGQKDTGRYVELVLPDKNNATLLDVSNLHRIQRRAKEIYETDPNKIDQKEVSDIFSEVLRTLDSVRSAA